MYSTSVQSSCYKIIVTEYTNIKYMTHSQMIKIQSRIGKISLRIVFLITNFDTPKYKLGFFGWVEIETSMSDDEVFYR